MYDVVIIGGGPAGLASALALGRSRKHVLLIDGGVPRNTRAQYIGGFITQDRVSPQEFRKVAHADLLTYSTIDLILDDVATHVIREGKTFAVRTSAVEHVARRVLLTTGLLDDPFPFDGSSELWGRSLFQCPYCHAYEHRGRTFGFLAPTEDDCAWAMLLRSWSRDVIVFTNASYDVTAETRAQLDAVNIPIVEDRIIELVREGDQLKAIDTEAALISCDVLFVRSRYRQVPTVADMGLATTDDGHLRVDAEFKTSMAGVYAAGDAASHYHGALAAASAGNQAAHVINHELTVELVEQGDL